MAAPYIPASCAAEREWVVPDALEIKRYGELSTNWAFAKKISLGTFKLPSVRLGFLIQSSLWRSPDPWAGWRRPPMSPTATCSWCCPTLPSKMRRPRRRFTTVVRNACGHCRGTVESAVARRTASEILPCVPLSDSRRHGSDRSVSHGQTHTRPSWSARARNPPSFRQLMELPPGPTRAFTKVEVFHPTR
jgi:hypothetical protein